MLQDNAFIYSVCRINGSAATKYITDKFLIWLAFIAKVLHINTYTLKWYVINVSLTETSQWGCSYKWPNYENTCLLTWNDMIGWVAAVCANGIYCMGQ